MIAPYIGTYGWLQYQKNLTRKNVKRQMITGLPKSELVLLKFAVTDALSDLKWEHSKEFEYRGQMYDVVEVETTSDTISYWCWWDHDETRLNQQLSSLVEFALAKNPQNKEKQEKLVDFFKTSYYTHSPAWSLHFDPTKTVLCINFSFGYFEFYNAPPVPPPRIA
jgi:hypothetical protein